MEFFKGNLWEIRRSTALQIFGGLLGLVHAITYWSWVRAQNLPLMYHKAENPMCWSLIENCGWVKFASPQVMEIVFHSFGVFAILATLAFWLTRMVGLGWFFLFVCFVAKGLLYIQDLRLSANYHYLILVLNICFLFVPNKANVLRWVIVSYYMCSGILKLSPNWLTGQTFADSLNLPIKLGEWLAAMALLVEMIAAPALWFRDLRNFLLAYLVLVGYHGMVWYAQGFSESSVMLVTLQIFPILYFEERKNEREYLYQSFIRPQPSPAWLGLVMTVFWLVQALPYLPHQHQAQLQHIEQSLALSPVAASDECDESVVLLFKDHTEEYHPEMPAERPAAFRCNSYLRFLDLKLLCQNKKSTPSFTTLASRMVIRGLTEDQFQTAYQSNDICNESTSFRSLMGAGDGI